MWLRRWPIPVGRTRQVSVKSLAPTARVSASPRLATRGAAWIGGRPPRSGSARVRHAAGVRPDRAHEEPDRAELRGRGRTGGTHVPGRAVARAVGRARGRLIDECDLAADRVGLFGELLERRGPNDLALEAPFRRGDAPPRAVVASGCRAADVTSPSRRRACRPSRRPSRRARWRNLGLQDRDPTARLRGLRGR